MGGKSSWWRKVAAPRRGGTPVRAHRLRERGRGARSALSLLVCEMGVLALPAALRDQTMWRVPGARELGDLLLADGVLGPVVSGPG